VICKRRKYEKETREEEEKHKKFRMDECAISF
jgi:hypothetical protein